MLLRTPGSDAYLLVDNDGPESRQAWLYDRAARRVSAIPNPGLLVGRGSWLSFDGDEVLVLRDARAIAPELPP